MSDIPVIPTFHLGSINTLKTREDIITYLIQFFFANPGWTNSYHEADMLSFRYTNAKHGSDPAKLADTIALQFSTVFAKYFPENTPLVSVTVDTINADGTFSLDLLVSDELGNPIIPVSKIKINTDGSVQPFINVEG